MCKKNGVFRRGDDCTNRVVRRAAIALAPKLGEKLNALTGCMTFVRVRSAT
ncbi:hypothetical protein [Octadecabacter antarcticus]|uniref:hypothetical protein n=1 Tax=Octadecabacter antarcticus TaxID=1217908 RepID=UPI0001806F3D